MVQIAAQSPEQSVAIIVQKARPDARVENAPAVAELCVRLDGLPLAIKLAAARGKQLSLQALLARLVKPAANHAPTIDLVNAGPRNVPVRQQTLRHVIEWSYHLLNPSEQRAFRLGSRTAVDPSGGGCAYSVQCLSARHGRELCLASFSIMYNVPCHTGNLACPSEGAHWDVTEFVFTMMTIVTAKCSHLRHTNDHHVTQ